MSRPKQASPRWWHIHHWCEPRRELRPFGMELNWMIVETCRCGAESERLEHAGAHRVVLTEEANG